MRNMLFISHANPEDNAFSQWLALQLAKEGYPVWCDLTQLLGGEDFWADIEHALRERTCKFLFVLSRSSNRKTGPLQELHLAQSIARRDRLGDFVVPLRVDSLPHNEFNIQLARLNAIDFNKGWSNGLRPLLAKLRKDGIEKDPRFSPASVASWWRNNFSGELGVQEEPEEYLSNWFPIRQMPLEIYFHSLTTFYSRRLQTGAFPYPARRQGPFLVSFATADDLKPGCPVPGMIYDSQAIVLEDFLRGTSHLTVARTTRDAENIVSDLLRKGWENSVGSMGMSVYRLANRRIAAFFRDRFLRGNKLNISRGDARRTTRNVVGFHTRKDVEGRVVGHRFWHFAIECRPMVFPIFAFTVVPHILLSSDGRRIWSDKGRLHRARRTEGRDWWNPEWRDRTLGMMQWLAKGEACIPVPLGGEVAVDVDATPVVFVSPVSYQEPEARQASPDDEEDIPDDGEEV